MLKKLLAVLLMAAAPAAAQKRMQVADPDNPTCPAKPNWSDHKAMKLTPIEKNGQQVLLAEGAIDAGLPDRLAAILAKNRKISEIWLRSPGGDARAGNAAGLVIRKSGRGLITRIPSGWACFSACNFVFMGGRARIIDPGGDFIVHMFTMTGDRNAIATSVQEGTESTAALIAEVEQDSAILASEDNDFLIRAGVSRKLLTDIMYRQKATAGQGQDKSTRRCLTIKEALTYSVANAED